MSNFTGQYLTGDGKTVTVNDGIITNVSEPFVPVIQLIDNQDSGFSFVGPWVLWSGQGYNNSIYECYKGNGSSIATWNFTIVPGKYKVSVTYFPYTNRATNSPFTVFDNTTTLETIQVNQQISPNDFMDKDVGWKNLGIYNFDSTKLLVKLTDNADGNLNADAIRIEKIEN